MLQVLSNLEIAATGPDLEQSDRLALNAYASPVSDLVWRLEVGQLLAAIDAGRQIDEIRAFLAARSGTALPDTVSRLLHSAPSGAGEGTGSSKIEIRC